MKIKETLKRLLLSIAGKSNYILYRNFLFTKSKFAVKNDWIKFIRRKISLPIDFELIHLEGEEFYLLLIHSDNIAHFFHDMFFPFYMEFRKNKKRVCVSIKGDQFQREFLESVIEPQYLIFLEYEKTYSFSDLIIVPEGRDLKLYDNYLEVCREIKEICFAKHHIIEKRDKNLIYGRNELSRKKLLNIDQAFLKANDLEQVSLSKLSFKDYLTTLSTASTFTYVVGAGVFNLLFLGPDVSVLEINPYRNNSWAQMFGMSALCKFHVVVTQNIQPSSAATQAEAILDSHSVFDETIAAEIKNLISSHNRHHSHTDRNTKSNLIQDH